jgi:hypothetical protein
VNAEAVAVLNVTPGAQSTLNKPPAYAEAIDNLGTHGREIEYRGVR